MLYGSIDNLSEARIYGGMVYFVNMVKMFIICRVRSFTLVIPSILAF